MPHRYEPMLRKLNHTLLVSRMGPLKAQEIDQLLKQVEPQTAIHARGRRAVADLVDPRGQLGLGEDPRTALFQSSVPLDRAVGRTGPVDQIRGEGFSGANPILQDPYYHLALRRGRTGET